MEILIRNAEFSDLKRICEVEKLAFTPDRQATPETFEKRLRIFPKGFYVLVSNGKISAFSTSYIVKRPRNIQDLESDESIFDKDGDCYYLRSLAVDKDFQKLGYGRMLVEKQLETAKEMNKKYFIFTCLKILENFYIKLGFSRIEEYTRFHGTEQALWEYKIYQ